LFQGSRRGMPVGITDKAEGKDLAALFTFMDWIYSLEGVKAVPNVILGTMSWEDYVAGREKIEADTAVDILQKYVNLAKGAKSK